MSKRSPQPIKEQEFFYAVGVGRSTGVFTSWSQIQPLVTGIKNAKYRKFTTMQEAKTFVEQHASPVKSSPSNKYSSPGIPTLSSPSTYHQSVQQPARDSLRAMSNRVKTQILGFQNCDQVSQQSTSNESSDFQNLPSSQKPAIDSLRAMSNRVKTQILGFQNCDQVSQQSTSNESSDYQNLPSSQKTSILAQLEDFRKRITTLEKNLNEVFQQKTNEIVKLKEEIKTIQISISSQNNDIESTNLLNTLLGIKKERVEEETEMSIKRPRLMEIADSSGAGPSNNNNDFRKHKYPLNMDSDGYCIIYTDGACLNNGQFGAKAGIGVWFGEKHPLNAAEPLVGDCPPTNNNAEIQAATFALNAAKLAGINKVCIHTDSEFTMNCVTKWMERWKRNGWRKADGKVVINRHQLELLDESLQNMDVKWVHVRGHSKIVGNEMADQLANEGAAKYISNT